MAKESPALFWKIKMIGIADGETVAKKYGDPFGQQAIEMGFSKRGLELGCEFGMECMVEFLPTREPIRIKTCLERETKGLHIRLDARRDAPCRIL